MTTTVAGISDEAGARQPRPQRERLLASAAFVAICAIWGTTFLAIRVAIETIPTLYLTGLRFTAAGVILLFVAALRGQPMPRRARSISAAFSTSSIGFTHSIRPLCSRPMNSSRR